MNFINFYLYMNQNLSCGAEGTLDSLVFPSHRIDGLVTRKVICGRSGSARPLIMTTLSPSTPYIVQLYDANLRNYEELVV